MAIPEGPVGTIATCIVVKGNPLDLDEVSAVFGLQSTRIWRCKPSVAAQVPELDGVEWIFETGALHQLSFSDAIDGLLANFLPRLDAVIDYCRSHNLTISVHLNPVGSERDFIFGFDRASSFHLLAKLDAELHIRADNLVAG